MKEWNNPQLFSLGVENTFTKDLEKNTHYCHRTKEWHANNCASGVLQDGIDHAQNDPCPTEGTHEWQGQSHKSKCCCGAYVAPGQS